MENGSGKHYPLIAPYQWSFSAQIEPLQNQKGSTGIADYVKSNKIPVGFLITLLLQFAFIVVDRVLYLRRNLRAKIVFHVLNVIGWHVLLFVIIPNYTKWLAPYRRVFRSIKRVRIHIPVYRQFRDEAGLMVFYCFKYLYLMFSSYQICAGYPSRILGHSLMKTFSIPSLVVYQMWGVREWGGLNIWDKHILLATCWCHFCTSSARWSTGFGLKRRCRSTSG